MLELEFYNDMIPDKGPVDHRYHEIHRANQESFKAQFLRFLPENKEIKILDIGCGSGQLIHMFNKLGYKNIEGVDLVSRQVEMAKRLGIKATQISELESYLNENKGKWDLITLSQVIEHFPKDKMLPYLAAIRSSLKDNGTLIATTHNMALLSGLISRYTDVTHEIGFTERSLIGVLRVASFSDIKVYPTKHPFSLHPKRLIWLLLRKIWFKILGFIYLLEKGYDRPTILSRHLMAVAKK